MKNIILLFISLLVTGYISYNYIPNQQYLLTNQNFTDNDLYNVDCLYFSSGGLICDNVTDTIIYNFTTINNITNNITTINNITNNISNIENLTFSDKAIILNNNYISTNSSINNGFLNIIGGIIAGNNITFNIGSQKNLVLYINSTDVNPRFYNQFAGSNAKLTIGYGKSSGNSFYYLYSGDNNELQVIKNNASDVTSSGGPGGAKIFNRGGAISILPNTDGDDYIKFSTRNNEVNISGVGFENIYFLDGNNWNTLHADAFTEHSNIYDKDTKTAYEDIKEYSENKHPVNLAPSTMDDNIEIIEFNTIGTDLGKMGKALSKVVINNKGEIDNLTIEINNLKNQISDINSRLDKILIK